MAGAMARTSPSLSAAAAARWISPHNSLTVAPDEAISTAGGVAWDGLDEGLQTKVMPGVYVAGEMLDWEAPTGGYLLTACMATGYKAALSVHAEMKGDEP